jgi:RNA recognition motif-containing protein
MKLFVGNLSWDATEEALQELFAQHGKVVSVRIVQDAYTGRSRGFGFVEMEDENAGNSAVAQLNESQFLGRPLRVSQARQEGERRERREGGGPRERREGGRGGQDRPRRPFRPREESQFT